MAWKNEKKKLLIAMDQDLYNKIVDLSKLQNRSIVNCIETLLMQNVNLCIDASSFKDNQT